MNSKYDFVQWITFESSRFPLEWTWLETSYNAFEVDEGNDAYQTIRRLSVSWNKFNFEFFQFLFKQQKYNRSFWCETHQNDSSGAQFRCPRDWSNIIHTFSPFDLSIGYKEHTERYERMKSVLLNSIEPSDSVEGLVRILRCEFFKTAPSHSFEQ